MFAKLADGRRPTYIAFALQPLNSEAMSLDPIAIVPARLASTRLPDKPLADLGGAR